MVAGNVHSAQHKPLVSIIIPTYNRAHLVTRAIKSIENQTYQNIQLIVVDDGSTDNTKEVISQLEGVEYYYKPNGGQGSARNFGLQYVKGEFVTTLDSDDMWYPLFLEEQIENIQKYDLDFGFANWHQDLKDGSHMDFFRAFTYLRDYHKYSSSDAWIQITYPDLRKLFTEACICPSSAMVFRKSTCPIKWNTQMNIADDWFLILDIIASKPIKVGFTYKPLWKKWVQDDNVCDGRLSGEVTYNLCIHDFKIIIDQFSGRFTEKELTTFKRYRVIGLLTYADKLFKKKNWKYKIKGLYHFSQGILENPKWGITHYLVKSKRIRKLMSQARKPFRKNKK